MGNRKALADVARELGPVFAGRAERHDEADAFVAENYADLKAAKAFSAGIPADLGGGGASHADLCAFLRELGRHCGSTALSLSMHSHLVAAAVWRHLHGQPAEQLLRRVASEELVLVSTGARDWLESNGKVERVEGGYRVSARKAFASGAPAGDLLLTSAPYDDPKEGPQVLHFPVPLKAEGVKILDDWRTHGMRGTGSNTVELDGAFVPDAAVVLRRPRGPWHPSWNVVATVAVPLIMSVYLGVAEAARDLAVQAAAKRRDDPDVQAAVGEMENALETARLATAATIQEARGYDFAPSTAAASAQFVRKSVAVRALQEVADHAVALAGGPGFYRAFGLERRVRDLRAAHFHPLPARRQHRFTGRVALGLDPVA